MDTIYGPQRHNSCNLRYPKTVYILYYVLVVSSSHTLLIQDTTDRRGCRRLGTRKLQMRPVAIAVESLSDPSWDGKGKLEN